MTKTKRIVSAFFCLIMLLSAFSSFGFSASAATYGGAKSASITVTTKANYWYPGASSVTLKQEKQTLNYKALIGNKTKAKTGYYGCYNITVYNITKNKTNSVYWGGGKTKKITLDPNCTYRITVKYNSNATAIFTQQPLGYRWKSTSNPSWRVNSTWKVSSYR